MTRRRQRRSINASWVTAFIPDPCPYPYAGVPTMADGIMADADGNVYGGDFLGAVRKFVKK